MAQSKQDMGSGNVRSLMLQLMIPAVVAQVVNLLYNRFTTCATTAGIMSCSIRLRTFPLPMSCFDCAMDVILLFTSNLNYVLYISSIILKTRKNTSPFSQIFPCSAQKCKKLRVCRTADPELGTRKSVDANRLFCYTI